MDPAPSPAAAQAPPRAMPAQAMAKSATPTREGGFAAELRRACDPGGETTTTEAATPWPEPAGPVPDAPAGPAADLPGGLPLLPDPVALAAAAPPMPAPADSPIAMDLPGTTEAAQPPALAGGPADASPPGSPVQGSDNAGGAAMPAALPAAAPASAARPEPGWSQGASAGGVGFAPVPTLLAGSSTTGAPLAVDTGSGQLPPGSPANAPEDRLAAASAPAVWKDGSPAAAMAAASKDSPAALPPPETAEGMPEAAPSTGSASDAVAAGTPAEVPKSLPAAVTAIAGSSPPTDPAAMPPPVVAEAAPAQGAAGPPPTGLSPAPAAAAGAEAPAPPPPAPRPTPPPPARQLAPIAIALALGPGQAPRLTVALEPEELGRVEIRIERSAEGANAVQVLAERPETLALLQRDARELDRALQGAGVAVDAGALRFGLSGEDRPDSRGAPGGGGRPRRLPAGPEPLPGAGATPAASLSLLDIAV